jgi:hypothetical protein
MSFQIGSVVWPPDSAVKTSPGGIDTLPYEMFITVRTIRMRGSRSHRVLVFTVNGIAGNLGIGDHPSILRINFQNPRYGLKIQKF